MVKKYGLIGCGMMGTEHIKNINLLDGAALHAVYETVEELAQQAAQLGGASIIARSIKELALTPGRRPPLLPFSPLRMQ